MEIKPDVFPKEKIKIALAQCSSVDGDIEENVNRAYAFIEEAGKKNVDIIMFPEKYLTGYVPEIVAANLIENTILLNDVRIQKLRQACKEYGIWSIIGTPVRKGEDIFISSIVIDSNGEEVGWYNKTHLFQTEKKIFSTNNEQLIIQLKGWNIGMSICYDAGFPEHSRLLAQNGCHLYMGSSLFSKGMGYKESRVWFPARALDNTIFTAMCNHVGKTGVWDACGHSGVWNPLGDNIIDGSQENVELLIAELDPALLNQARKGENMLADSFAIKEEQYSIKIIGNLVTKNAND
ncbi:carbon-nitrogen hydrolase family protein [Paenibacillus pini]|uniref:Nitrilase/cyanide hydratase and apolipoprotein N-acyltransferase n=1 Tax=Paenibacillus pini JCM 16418 TaxID=1236976 RepID=W7Z116_9BACL|nr:carbon-nitrogen hydrolase family protein [Paenibacillus pini]GAF10676.1 nitrilase/cyanide hydratase and apolipoprotein N-acyltransferase [Paenibacillus pini JCM 16418]